MKAAALPILVDTEHHASSNIMLEMQRACGARNTCIDVRYTPDVIHSMIFEKPSIDQSLSLMDDVVPFDDGSAAVTPLVSTSKPVSVPEPGTLVLLAAGLFFFTMRRLGSS